MTHLSMTRRLVAFAALLLASNLLEAQFKPLIVAPIDTSKQVMLSGSVSPLLKDAQDLGAADTSQPAGRILLILKRSPQQEADLQNFLREVHTSGTANYRQWIPAGKFADRFGSQDSDVRQITGWLQSQGLTVSKIAAGRMAVEFTGTLGQVGQALSTSIHRYSVTVDGKPQIHFANATAAKVPEALTSAIAGISGLSDFVKPTAQNKVLGQAAYDAKTHSGKGQWTYPGLGSAPTYYFITPQDFATQYNIKPVYSSGINGAGQIIGIINDSNIDVSLVNAYRSLFQLPVNPPQVIIDGNDPGINSDAIEAYLDVENAGAIAPNATVKLYIAGGNGYYGDGGLFFAMSRAVDDDVATSLSISFSTCEEVPTSTNQYFSQLWEQAAAQGQTVFVSSGDSGSRGCTGGLGVNGLASTPWDVAVGGSDFYFTDYASGGASVANYWSSTNAANLSSLQEPMTEQVWNGSVLGFNSTTYDPLSSQIDRYGDVLELGASGGGASYCATSNIVAGQYPPYDCYAGYPKPAWQSATGVPQDGVRDLPDISLFASSGYNGVVWPICASPGDCTVNDPTTGELLITGVGGTSASTPAMAGVMALINQKYGPQGQANYVLYPLAMQFPSSIRPITLGNNDEPCASYQPGCVQDTNDSYLSLQHYDATPGYNQAAGLGSIDVANLLSNWKKITFKPSATTLNLSATSITHGQSVTANVAVTGAGTPGGGVSLVTNSTLDAYQGITVLDLGTTGSASKAIDFLPGGTYTVAADYSGDSFNAASKSAPVTLTVAPETSAAALVGTYFDDNSYEVHNITPATALFYGFRLTFDVTITGASAPANGSNGTATGSVVFMDGTTRLGSFPINTNGVAEYTEGTLSVGNHSITATYAGDASFKGSTSQAVNFTVLQSVPNLGIGWDPSYTFDPNTNSPIYTVGQSVMMEGVATTTEQGIPTGTITYQFGTRAPVTVPLVAQDLEFFGHGAQSPIPLPNLTAGTQILTVTYNGDVNYAAITGTQTIEVVPPTLAPSTTTVVLTSPTDPASVTPSTFVTLTATITGSGSTAPTGTATPYFVDFLQKNSVALIPGSGNTSTATFVFQGADLLSGTNPIVIGYSGDSVYSPSTSAVVDITASQADFSIVSESANIGITSGQSGTATLALAALSGFNSTLALTCSAPASVTCSLSPPSFALSSTGTVTLTVNTATKTAINHHLAWHDIAAGSTLACLFFFLVPTRRRLGCRILSMLLLGIALSAGVGCGSSSQPPLSPNAPAGTYAVVVTATAPSGTIHNVSITIVVQ